MHSGWFVWAFGAWFLAACSDLAVPPAGERPRVFLAPLQPDGAEPVLRIELELPATQSAPLADLKLYQGELSESAARAVQQRAVPASLAAREQGCLCWTETAARVVCAPVGRLLPGERYTFVLLGDGALSSFTVSQTPSPLLERLFPPPGSAGGPDLVVCGDSAPTDEIALELAPFAVRALLRPAFGVTAAGKRCNLLQLQSTPPDAPLMLPPNVGGWLLDPNPLWMGEATAFEPLECTIGEMHAGPACVEVQDDRVLFRSGSEPLLFRFQRGEVTQLERTLGPTQIALTGLAPATQQRLAGFAFDRFGRRFAFDLEFETQAARPRWVLNEVLANPVGAEPTNEWIELVNASAAAAELQGARLEDGGGSVELPALRAEAGEALLLVREDFEPNTGVDVTPAAATQLIRLPSLGKNGLTNSGEALLLRAADGAVLSRFPAVSSPHAGVSIARRDPADADDVASAFGEHAEPGASPGAPNVLRDPTR